MAPHSLDGSSQALWDDGERVFRRGWQLDDHGKRHPVLIVQPASDHPSRSSLDRLTHEYELKDELDETWAMRPLDLVRDSGRNMLVFEDAGVEPLERLLGPAMEMGRFLHLAVGVAVALRRLHQRGLVHKDIKPANILVNAAEPMEWVHCHLARRPVAPAERLKEIPGAVSAIVMKLLAKRAEDRYQTAAGLESDLRRCLTESEAQRRTDDFPLGEQDKPDRLLIPEKLYGRQREVETLLAAFDRIVNGGAPELVLVSGYSGI